LSKGRRGEEEIEDEDEDEYEGDSRARAIVQVRGREKFSSRVGEASRLTLQPQKDTARFLLWKK
jgi:hypothetical protein